MPTFDIVSEIDQHELANAVDQSNRELANRFDFKGANAQVTQQEGALQLEADSEFQVQQILMILHQKAAKRGLDVAFFDEQPVEISGQRARQRIIVQEGIERELAKRIIKDVKESKIKVQTQQQGEQLRVSGKKRDDLQQVIALLRGGDYPQPLQFINFRD